MRQMLSEAAQVRISSLQPFHRLLTHLSKAGAVQAAASKQDDSLTSLAASQAALAAETQGTGEALRGAASTGVAGAPRRRCGTPDPTPAQQRRVEGVIAQSRGEGQRVTGPIKVDIHFTVFTTVGTQTPGTSNVLDSVIQRQVADMNTFYNRYVRFLHTPLPCTAPARIHANSGSSLGRCTSRHVKSCQLGMIRNGSETAISTIGSKI